VTLGGKKVFVDTNIWVYSVDSADNKKMDVALDILAELDESCTIVTSTQVMGEFYNAATRYLGIDPFIANDFVKDLERFEQSMIAPYTVREAIEISRLNRLSYYDSLHLAAAAQKKCAAFYTEDMNHGQIIAGVEIINPFL